MQETTGSGASVAAGSSTQDPQASARTGKRPRYGDTVFPEHHLDLRAWPDPVLDELGHDPRSHYAERFWVSVLGPSCYLATRRFVERLDRQPDGVRVSTVELALELGLGAKGGRHGPLWRAIERMCHFRIAHRQGPVLAVRRRLPPLSNRQIKRMPDHLALAHEQWQHQHLALVRRRTVALPPHQIDQTTDTGPGDQAA